MVLLFMILQLGSHLETVTFIHSFKINVSSVLFLLFISFPHLTTFLCQSCFGLKWSPGSRDISRTGSAEDLLSDATSVASDVSDSSFNTSLPVKRGLPAPSKVNHFCCLG